MRHCAGGCGWRGFVGIFDSHRSFDALCTSLVPRPKTTKNTTTQNITPTTTNATLLNPPQHHHTHHSAIDRLYPCFHAESSLSFPVPLLPRPPTREVSAPLFLWLFPFTMAWSIMRKTVFPPVNNGLKDLFLLASYLQGKKLSIVGTSNIHH